MKTIWLVNPYGPIEGEKWRDYSFNQIGKYLAENSFNVVWWTSNFAHHFKKYRSEGWKDIQVRENFTIRLVPSTSYKKNISFGRFFKDYVFSTNAKKMFLNLDKPDLIIESLNPLTMGNPTYKYSKKNNIPVIIDQMDIWPEFIVKQLNVIFRPFVNLLFLPIYFKRKRIYQNAKGFMALGRNYLDFALRIGKVSDKQKSVLVYNGIDTKNFHKLMQYEDTSELKNIIKNDDIWFVFAGTLGPSYDIVNVLSCAESLEKSNQNVKFIFAGSGPLDNEVRLAQSKLKNVIFLGPLLPEQLAPIYKKCDIGLSTYTLKSNVDMPDKFYDYTAAGLAIINSLRGEVREIIEVEKVGINYNGGDKLSLISAINQCVESKRTLEIFKKNSSKLGTKYDSSKQNKKLLNMINDILEIKESGNTCKNNNQDDEENNISL